MLRLPAPESVNIGSNPYRDNYVSLYPYSHDYNNTLQQYGVTVPFEIIDRSMGVSTCQKCKQTYAGYQDKCVKENYYYKSSWNSRFLTKKEALKNNLRSYSSSEVTEGYEKCEAWCTWSLNGEFSEQKRFFSMIEMISELPDEKQLFSILQYKDQFPPGVAERLIYIRVAQDVENMKMELASHRVAITEIVDRIQSAGGILSCGSSFL